MTAVYLFAGLLGLLVLIGLIVSPLLEREPVPEDEADPAQRRDQELEALREVEFEYRTGKLSEEDYRELRARHGQAAVEARHRAESQVEDGDAKPGDAGDAVGAADTGGRQASEDAADDGAADDDPGFCPSCGAEARPGARFCSSCGNALEDGDG